MATKTYGPYDTGNSNVDYRIVITTSSLNTSANTVKLTAALQFKNTAGYTGKYANTQGTDYPVANYTIALNDTSTNTTNTWSITDISNWKTLISVERTYSINSDNTVSFTYSAYSSGTVTMGSLNTSGNGSIASGKTGTTYTISYDGNGNTGGTVPASQTKTPGVALTLSSSVPTKTNNTFLGWAVDNPNATLSDYQPEDSYAVDASATLYAVWTTGSICTITYNANSGEGTMATQKVNSAQTTPLSACLFTKEGYQFAGWAISDDGAVIYRDCQRINGITDNTKTLYAIWVPKNNKRVWIKINGVWE